MCDDFITSIKGYHVNDQERCIRFINERNYLITSRDIYWLGFGMYFWDNNSNADYWMKEKHRKDPNGTYIKVSANIYIDEEYLLDLTDEATVDRLEYLWEMYCKKKNEDKKQPLGVKIDKLINFFDMLGDIKLVRGIGKYNNKKEKINSFINNNSNKYSPHIECSLKVIYCARNNEIVFNRKQVI